MPQVGQAKLGSREDALDAVTNLLASGNSSHKKIAIIFRCILSPNAKNKDEKNYALNDLVNSGNDDIVSIGQFLYWLVNRKLGL